VSSRKAGQKVFYRISGDDVLSLFSALREVAERHIADVGQLIQTYLEVKDHLEPLPARELLSRVREGLVTVVDVRPPEEYATGHIPGAVSIPLAELEQRLDELDPDREIVAYCRGPHCVLAFDAVAMLRDRGRRASRFDGGLPEWRLQGQEVETGGMN
jgi:rhodanese-related sulfurtransferase